MGVIGGPDGPTVMVVSTTPAGIAILAVLAAAVLVAVIRLFRRKK